VHTDGDSDLQFLAHRRRLAQVAGAAAHAQPVHGHRVEALLLQPVHAHIRGAGFGVLGDHQAERDDPPPIPRPGPQQRQGVEVHLISLEHLLAAGGGEIEVGLGLEHIQQHRAETHRLARPFRRSGLLQQRQPLAQGLQFLGPLHAQAPEHPLLGAHQVDRHRHRRADHVFKQEGGPTGCQHPVGDRRQLLVGIHRGGDAAQLTPLLQQLQKAAQVAAAARAGEGRWHGWGWHGAGHQAGNSVLARPERPGPMAFVL
jgi:hypothetical protein